MKLVVWADNKFEICNVDFDTIDENTREIASRISSHDAAIEVLMTTLANMRSDLGTEINKTYRLQLEMESRVGKMEELLMDLRHSADENDIALTELRKRIDSLSRKYTRSTNEQADRMTALEIASLQRSREGYRVADSSEVVSPENVVASVAGLKEDLSELKGRIGDMMNSLGLDRINEVNILLSRFDAKLDAMSQIETEWHALQAWVKAELLTINSSIATIRTQLTPESKKIAGKTVRTK